MLRSFFHKSSSVAKAVEEAWVSAGKPASFSIKIIEREISGFLWFGNKPAVISFTYTFEPKDSLNTINNAHANAGAQTIKPNHSSSGSGKSSQNKAPLTQNNTTTNSVAPVIKRRELQPKAPTKRFSKEELPTTNKIVEEVPRDRPSSVRQQRTPRKSVATSDSKGVVANQDSLQANNSSDVPARHKKVALDVPLSNNESLLDIDYSNVNVFVQGFFEVVIPGSSAKASCAIVGKDLNVTISGLDAVESAIFTSSQVSWALSSLIALVLKKDFGKKFQKYRVMILFA